MSDTVRVTAVNHVAQDIACTPEELYRDILATYVDAGKFTGQDFRVELLAQTDPAAFRGGYRLTMTNAVGQPVDDRICRVTERDDAARRISMRADYLAPGQMGMTVYATYHAAPGPLGTRYHIDCHSDLDIEPPADSSPAKLAGVVAELERQFDLSLIAYLDAVKAKLEDKS